jgi:hypothetical protein
MNSIETFLIWFAIAFVAVYGTLHWNWIALIRLLVLHFYTRMFKGEQTTAMPFRGGTVITYASGYTEFVSNKNTTDAALAEYFGRVPWTCNGIGARGTGCSGTFYTPPMTRKQAELYVTDLGHSVAYIDDKEKFIFYRTPE